jgi:hypothetical protein
MDAVRLKVALLAIIQHKMENVFTIVQKGECA